MASGEIISELARILGESGIPYMITGSIAGAYHGVARATLDIDVVIDPSVDQLRVFVGRLSQPRYYVDLEAALDAKRRESMFNVIDVPAGWKFDLIIKKSRPFSREEFERRQQVDLLGARAFVASAEDVVISKLEWAKLGQSQRQIEDVAGVLRARPDLDLAYLDRWVRDLHLEGQWRAASELARG